MEEEIERITLISNGSIQFYPDNTLTNFKNVFPKKLELNSKYEVAIESLGFCTKFNDCYFPTFKKGKLANFFIGSKDYTITTEIPTYGNIKVFLENKLKEINLKLKTNFHFLNNRLIFETNLEQDISLIFHTSFMKSFGLYNEKEIKLDNNPYIIDSELDEKFVSDNFRYLNEKDKYEFKNFVKGIKYSEILTKLNEYTPYAKKQTREKLLEENNEMDIYFRTFCDFLQYIPSADPNFENYIVFFIEKNTKSHLKCLRDITKTIYPSLIKIQSENILNQSYNNSYSKDLIIFAPNFSKQENYYYQEFETKQFCEISTTTLDNFQISIVDEKNKYLELDSGIASIVKLVLRKMNTFYRHINVRLTSEPTLLYPNNNQTDFIVKLPNPLILDKSWKVCLTSITYSPKFTLFQNKDTMISFRFKDESNEDGYSVSVLNLHEKFYNSKSLIKEIDNFLKTNNLGSLSFNEDNILKLIINKEGVLLISKHLLEILGYNAIFPIDLDNVIFDGAIDQIKPDYTLPFVKETKIESVSMNDTQSDIPVTYYTITFDKGVNTNINDPSYIILYSDIITPSLIGGIYSKVLRVINVHSIENQPFVNLEFKNKEYCHLESTEINEIKLFLRTHAGDPVNFLKNHVILLNLEFTNDVKILQ